MGLGLGLALRAGGEIFEEIRLPPGANISISNVRIDAHGSELRDIEYDFNNHSNRAVVAFELWWDIYAQGDSEPIRIAVSRDSWNHYQGILQSGASWKNLDLGATAVAKAPIERIVATLTYVEFADGQKLGPEAESFYRSLSKRRTEMLAVYPVLMEIYNRSGTKGVEEAIKRRNLPGRLPSVGASSALAALRGIFEHEGIQGVLLEISKAQQQLP